MTPTELAALLTAGAGLLAALSQWLRLFGLPFTGKRNGARAWLRYIEDRLTATERALADCLALQAAPTERHRTPAPPVAPPSTSTPRKEPPPMKHALTKWNSRLVALAAGGISTLATIPDLPHDIRAIGIILVTGTGLLMIALRDILGPSAGGRAPARDEALHDLSLDHAPPNPPTGDLPQN